MYVRGTQSGQFLCPGPRVQPRPEDPHQALDPGDYGHSDEQQPDGPAQQIFAVNI